VTRTMRKALGLGLRQNNKGLEWPRHTKRGSPRISENSALARPAIQPIPRSRRHTGRLWWSRLNSKRQAPGRRVSQSAGAGWHLQKPGQPPGVDPFRWTAGFGGQGRLGFESSRAAEAEGRVASLAVVEALQVGKDGRACRLRRGPHVAQRTWCATAFRRFAPTADGWFAVGNVVTRRRVAHATSG
jgi:hypothetical protein